MENNFSPTATDNSKKSDAQKLVNDLRGEARYAAERGKEVVDRGREAAADVAGAARVFIDEVKASGREFADEYAQVVKRSRRRLSDVSTRVGEYADDNTALVAGGALVLGVLLGVALTRRNA